MDPLHRNSSNPIEQNTNPLLESKEPKKPTTLFQNSMKFLSSIFNRHTNAPRSLEGRVHLESQQVQKNSFLSRLIEMVKPILGIANNAKIAQAISLVRANPLELKNLDRQLQNNREVVMAAVSQNGMALQHASPSMKADLGIVMAAVSQNGMALTHAAHEVHFNEQIIRAAFTQNFECYGAIPENSRFLVDDIILPDNQRHAEIHNAISQVSESPRNLELLRAPLKTNHQVVLAAVRADGMALQYAGYSPTNNPRENLEIAQAAYDQNPDALQFISPKIRSRINRYHSS